MSLQPESTDYTQLNLINREGETSCVCNISYSHLLSCDASPYHSTMEGQQVTEGWDAQGSRREDFGHLHVHLSMPRDGMGWFGATAHAVSMSFP